MGCQVDDQPHVSTFSELHVLLGMPSARSGMAILALECERYMDLAFHKHLYAEPMLVIEELVKLGLERWLEGNHSRALDRTTHPRDL